MVNSPNMEEKVMTFKSRKDNLFTVVIVLLSVFIASMLYLILDNKSFTSSDYIPVFILISVLLLVLWIYNDTKYQLSTKKGFCYQSGPFKGCIPIENIIEITKNKTLWVGLKPATAQKGLIIKYKGYNEIYISPKTNNTFITEILKHNSSIKIN